MSAPPGHANRTRGPLLVHAGMVAPLVLAAGAIAAGLTWPDFRHRTQNLSDLGGTQAPYPLIMNTAFLTFGLLVIVFAVGLRRIELGRTSPLLVACFGAMMALLGVTPCTPGCAEGTGADAAHTLAALTGFLVIIAAMLVSWRRARSDPGSKRYAVGSAWSALVVSVFLVGWVVASEVDPERLLAGVHQRVATGTVLLWLLATAAHALTRTRNGAHHHA